MQSGRKANGASGLTDAETYVLNNAPQILSALLRRQNGTETNDLVDEAARVAAAIFNRVHTPKPTQRDAYLLQHAPLILSSLLLRRQSTTPEALIEPTLSIVGRLYDVVHDIDVPAEAMVSQPVDLRH